MIAIALLWAFVGSGLSADGVLAAAACAAGQLHADFVVVSFAGGDPLWDITWGLEASDGSVVTNNPSCILRVIQ